MSKTVLCTECGIKVSYTTKKPKLCKECHNKLYGNRKHYKTPKGMPAKSKGEYALAKLLDRMLPGVPCIDG